jgi:hypothetical protein
MNLTVGEMESTGSSTTDPRNPQKIKKSSTTDDADGTDEFISYPRHPRNPWFNLRSPPRRRCAVAAKGED